MGATQQLCQTRLRVRSGHQILSTSASVPSFALAVLPLTLPPLFLSFSSFPLHLSLLFQYWTLPSPFGLLPSPLILSSSSSSSASALRKQPHFQSDSLFLSISSASLILPPTPSLTHFSHISFLGNSLREVGEINWKRCFVFVFFSTSFC